MAGYINIVAINDPFFNAETLADKIKFDSAHLKYQGQVHAKNNSITVDGHEIAVMRENEPDQMDWGKFGEVVVAECTGQFNSRYDAGKHLVGGAKKVIISAPAEGADKTIVMGVNDHEYVNGAHHVISNASCTTNCLAPLVYLLDMNFGVESGVMSTIHAYTSDQRLMDTAHTDPRRARAAASNIIPTSTGAEKALALVLPGDSGFGKKLREDSCTGIKGRLDAISLRVPVIVGSLVDLTVKLVKKASAIEVNDLFLNAGTSSKFSGILEYSTENLVSTDVIGNPHSCVFDSKLTAITLDGVRVYAWYDNEWGFSNRMYELAMKLTLHNSLE